MNKLKIYLIALFALLLNSCIENEEIVFTKSVVEFDAATYNAKSVVAGQAKDYPLLSRTPKYGTGVVSAGATADPLITRTSGAIRLRVNLIGAQKDVAQEISYQVVPEETTAVAGRHFNTSGKVTIPANSSFGEIEIQILNPGTSSATPVRVVLELLGADGVEPSANYKRIGISISQT